MTKKLFALYALSLMAALAWGQVEGGLVQGVASASSDVTVFRGIPYAAPPVGDLRWKRPLPVVKWEGVRKTDTFSNICWQPGNAVGTFYGPWDGSLVHFDYIFYQPHKKNSIFCEFTNYLVSLHPK